MGTLLTWLNDKTSEVYIVATANDVTSLPPEVLRKGRFDELFYVGMPNPDERKAIWKIQLAKYKRNPDDFDLPKLVRNTDGFTGAEIEQVVKDGLFTAFGNGRTELSTDILLSEIKETSPLSKITADKIEAIEQWAKGRCRPATKGAVIELKKAPKPRRLD